MSDHESRMGFASRLMAIVIAPLLRNLFASLTVLTLLIAVFIGGFLIGRPPAPEATPVAEESSGESQSGEPAVYTCSMHPQIRLEDASAKCPICFMDLIVVEQDADVGESTLVMTPEAMKLAEIQTTPVQRFFPSATLRLVGRVEFDETRRARIAAYFPGRVERMFVNYDGMQVREGDHLAEVYSPELLAAFAELRETARTVDALQGETGAAALARNAARDTLESARAKLRLWGVTADQIADAEQSDEPVERLTIYSPISGVVVSRRVVEGAYVRTGDPIYTIADLSHLWVSIDAYESDLPYLRYGQTVTFTTDAVPGRRFDGRVSFIGPTLTGDARTVRVRVNVDNRERLLKPGMFVRAIVQTKLAGPGAVIEESLAGKWISPMHPEIVKDGPGECDVCGIPLAPAEELGFVTQTENVEPPLVIPATAPLVTGTRAVVYVRIPNSEQPTFEGREIVLGPRAGNAFIVLEGLEEREDVVTQGSFKIDSALQILGKRSMMSMTSDPGSATDAADRPDLPESFYFSLRPVYGAYFGMQEALATDDLQGFRWSATDLGPALGDVDLTGVTGEALGMWRRYEARLREHDQQISSLDDIDQVRVLFETYAVAMLGIEATFGHIGRVSYHRAYCPMAFDNTGAEWLQRGETINNPYFGSMMLRCGEIREVFEPKPVGGAP